MNRYQSPQKRLRLLGGMLAMMIVVVTLSACGSIGGDDNDPTSEPSATIWPTLAPEETVPSTATSVPSVPTSPSSPEAVTTPDADGEGISSPVAEPTALTTGEPTVPIMELPLFATPEAVVTLGASPESPMESDVQERATPTDATPASATIATSCEPDDIPAFSGEDANYLSSEDVNFRTGPGSDCDVIGEPLGPNVAMTVLSDPVVRDDDPDTEWVQVEVDGQTGWVSADFIEPAS